MPTHTSYSGSIGQLVHEYRIRGQREAAAHRPPSDAAHPDENESELKARAQEAISSEQTLFDLQVGEAARASVDTRQKAIELQVRSQQLVSDDSLKSTVEADLAGERPVLISATEARVRAEVDWRHFRAANGITEQASYPESHIWHFAWIAVLALIETIVNAFFFENQQGLLGGFVIALAISILNMSTALVLGIFFRQKNLAALDKRVIGWACFVAFVLLTLYFNALFATFRSEYSVLTDPSNNEQLRRAFASASSQAKDIYTLNLQLADLMSFILFGIGVILSGLAFWKGYTFDDKYPGHGQKDRRFRAARKSELERQDLVRQKVKDFLHHRRAEIHGAVNEPTQLVARVSGAFTSLSGARNMLTTQADAIQRDYRLVLEAYRQANIAVRGTDPPAYFTVYDDLTAAVSGRAGDQVLDQLKDIQREIAALRDEIGPPLNKKLQQLQEQSAELLNKFLEGYMSDVEQEAKKNIDRHVPTMERVSA